MALPKVEFERIINALKTFDSDYRYGDEFIGWEMRQNQKYAIQYEGKLYPPKMIISLATGVPRSEFSGGQQSNRYLNDYGFDVIVFAGRVDDLKVEAREVPGKVAKEDYRIDSWLANESCGDHQNMVRLIYRFLKMLPRFNCFTDMKQLPDNGIYFFFEVGEGNLDGLDRLVRIGTHRSDRRLSKRIRQHYSGNRNSSVFRKHLGGAMINRECPDRVCLEN